MVWLSVGLLLPQPIGCRKEVEDELFISMPTAHRPLIRRILLIGSGANTSNCIIHLYPSAKTTKIFISMLTAHRPLIRRIFPIGFGANTSWRVGQKYPASQLVSHNDHPSPHYNGIARRARLLLGR